ncbi:CoA pyrophosphatase [Marivibrio halodurans]|nr:CoA pyrophosphatase [Marivibrio halodurans]
MAGDGANDGDRRMAEMEAETIIARLEAARRAARPRRGDADLNPDMAPTRPTLIPAAVLVPIILHPSRPTVLLTRRTDHLTDHAGQISFPGGKVDPGDADARAAALRETREEVGIAPERIEIVGDLDPYVTRTGFQVEPIVGFLRPPVAPRPDPFEVAEVFEVPLSFLIDRRNHQRHSREFEGRTRHFYAMPYDRHYIWGATAGMLVNLADVLEGVAP